MADDNMKETLKHEVIEPLEEEAKRYIRQRISEMSDTQMHGNAQPQKSTLEKLALPLAVAFAGLFVGIGLILVAVMGGDGGSSSSGSNNNNIAPAAAPPSASASALNPQSYEEQAERLGIDLDDFRECVSSGRYAQKVQDHLAEGTNAGVSGTPGNIVIGPDGTTYFVSGAQPIATFQGVIDAILTGSPAPVDIPVGGQADNVPPVTDDDHIFGDKDAPVKIVEYSDFECPFCASVHPTLKQLVVDYDGDVAWVYRHYPLDFHPNAQPAAEASECIAELGGNDEFWEFSDYIFANQ